MEIIWTQNAQDEFIKNLLFLESEWSFSVAKKFESEVFKKLELLKTNSNTFLKSGYAGTQKMFITKHISLYYLVEEEKIILLHLWNNAQNPENLIL
jgi:plasmid stabilization system protein ParE